jgi:hypothetical protein
VKQYDQAKEGQAAQKRNSREVTNWVGMVYNFHEGLLSIQYPAPPTTLSHLFLLRCLKSFSIVEFVARRACCFLIESPFEIESMSLSFASEDITELAGKFTPSTFYTLKSRFPDCDDETLARFLIARNGDIDKASQLLNAHLNWRSENLPIVKSTVVNELYKGKVYAHGVDKEGHPLVVYLPRFNDPSVRDLEEMSRSLLYWTESVLESMPSNKSKATILVDRTGNSQPDMDFIKFVAKAFQDNYPERAYRFIIYPGGLVFTTLWNLIKLFIDPVTANKVNTLFLLILYCYYHTLTVLNIILLFMLLICMFTH